MRLVGPPRLAREICRSAASGRFLEQDFLRLEGFTRDERHAVISRVREAFAASDASILDFKMFSNVSLNINFELPARRIGELANALAATGLRLSAASRAALDDWRQRCDEGASSQHQAEIAGALHITFIHHEPDLRLHVPPIPG
ncbi:MAG TPA: hypothetical protein VK363_04305 [Pyrinomonadaceae bacterium]|nr:hypothetical protein [Pyrinomonadaceae bacterium]